MKKALKYFGFILAVFLLTNIITWAVWGKDALLERGVEYLLDRGVLEFHTKDELYIVTKKNGKVIAHEYDIRVPNKIVKTLNSESEVKSYFRSEGRELAKTKATNILLEIDLINNSPLWGEVWPKIIPFDESPMGENIVFTWMLFCWVRLPGSDGR